MIQPAWTLGIGRLGKGASACPFRWIEHERVSFAGLANCKIHGLELTSEPLLQRQVDVKGAPFSAAKERAIGGTAFARIDHIVGFAVAIEIRARDIRFFLRRRLFRLLAIVDKARDRAFDVLGDVRGVGGEGEGATTIVALKTARISGPSPCPQRQLDSGNWCTGIAASRQFG